MCSKNAQTAGNPVPFRIVTHVYFLNGNYLNIVSNEGWRKFSGSTSPLDVSNDTPVLHLHAWKTNSSWNTKIGIVCNAHSLRAVCKRAAASHRLTFEFHSATLSRFSDVEIRTETSVYTRDYFIQIWKFEECLLCAFNTSVINCHCHAYRFMTLDDRIILLQRRFSHKRHTSVCVRTTRIPFLWLCVSGLGDIINSLSCDSVFVFNTS